MHRLIILASVVMLAASGVNCANSPERSNANILGPSASDGGSATVMPAGKGGGGKPGGGGTTGGGGGSIALVMVTDVNGDGLPNFHDVVTFKVSTTATASPWVTLRCYQNGTIVSQVSNGIFPTSLWENFTLGPSIKWQSGAADCTATLEIYNGSALASLSFHVSA